MISKTATYQRIAFCWVCLRVDKRVGTLVVAVVLNGKTQSTTAKEKNKKSLKDGRGDGVAYSMYCHAILDEQRNVLAIQPQTYRVRKGQVDVDKYMLSSG